RLAVVAVHLKDMVHGKAIESPVDTLRRNVALHAALAPWPLGTATTRSLRRAQQGPRLVARPALSAVSLAAGGVNDAVHDGENGTELDGHGEAEKSCATNPLLAVPPFPSLDKELSENGTIATHEFAEKQGAAGMTFDPGPDALVGTIEHEEEHGVEAMHKGELTAAAAAAEADGGSDTPPPLQTCVVDLWERQVDATQGIETTMKWDGARAAKRGMVIYRISQLETLYVEVQRALAEADDDADEQEAEQERFEIGEALASAWSHNDTLE
ncbi:unnamed protein product, partial [Prorocentrum cordatum]